MAIKNRKIAISCPGGKARKIHLNTLTYTDLPGWIGMRAHMTGIGRGSSGLSGSLIAVVITKPASEDLNRTVYVDRHSLWKLKNFLFRAIPEDGLKARKIDLSCITRFNETLAGIGEKPKKSDIMDMHSVVVALKLAENSAFGKDSVVRKEAGTFLKAIMKNRSILEDAFTDIYRKATGAKHEQKTISASMFLKPAVLRAERIEEVSCVVGRENAVEKLKLLHSTLTTLDELRDTYNGMKHAG